MNFSSCCWIQLQTPQSISEMMAPKTMKLFVALHMHFWKRFLFNVTTTALLPPSVCHRLSVPVWWCGLSWQIRFWRQVKTAARFSSIENPLMLKGHACYNRQWSKVSKDSNKDKFKHTNRKNKHHQQTLLSLGERLDSTEEQI